MKTTIIEYEDQVRRRDWIIAILLFFTAVLILLVYAFAQQKPSDDQACVPKMQGIYQSLQENYVVAVIDTNTKAGQQLTGELQNAINQINKLQLQGGTTP